MGEVRVREAVADADRAACFAIREDVFVAELGVPEDLEYDAYDNDASLVVHVLAVDSDGTPLGTGRLLYGPGAATKTGGEPGLGSLDRLAVTRHVRGLGVGAALVRGIEEAARLRGLTTVGLHAQTHALGFYERLGYVAYGPEFEEAGLPHQSMRRGLGSGGAEAVGVGGGGAA
ncbi:GNAT family N-acetyltransferase [Streptomyces sp. NA04227]|uniref:GNAT family N-acetyltransferase n=1 Tax=Streptomyces sp. NA04227 TaxID=2742136 RepID=UPI0015927215|nr:GNAT family N-acetyltransferase [Streptomyces sp. NA04227]QKW05982.1 GNAT family N-acetyltransferase [Streptomyces sp. NA04227]